MEKQTVLYVNYVDAEDRSSGSGVRPAKMLQAFRESGYDLIVLSGEQTSKERPKRIQAALKAIQEKKPDLCYIESPTYPIIRHEDRMLIRTIHRMGIPIGYFYRDFYRRFPEEFPRRRSLLGRIKDFGLDMLQYLTDQCLKDCDIVYVPSEEAARLLKYKDIRPLPPAGENHLPSWREPNKIAVYVGGLQGQYDIGLVLDAFSLLNREDQDYKLIIVCREMEWKKYEHPLKEAQWVEVHHVSENQLKNIYSRASIAVSAKNQNSRYNDFAVSVKTYEYMGFGLPQVVCEGKAVRPLIEKEGIGLAVSNSKEEFAQAVSLLFKDRSLYDSIQNNVRSSLLKKNLWIHRVKTVVEDLTGTKKGN